MWLVEITMPKKLVEDTFNGYMNRMREDLGIGRTEKVDAAPAQPADTMAAGMAPAAPAAPVGGAPSVPAA